MLMLAQDDSSSNGGRETIIADQAWEEASRQGGKAYVSTERVETRAREEGRTYQGPGE